MPNRDNARGFGGPVRGGSPGRRDRDPRSAQSTTRSGPEDRSFSDADFQTHDAHLNAELERYEKEHRGSGYPLGGSRFGFFALERAHDYHPEADYDFDADYLHWRDQQLQRHDRDYGEWRRHQRDLYDEEYRRFRDERREDFHERFQDWRAKRDAEAAAVAAAANPDDKL